MKSSLLLTTLGLALLAVPVQLAAQAPKPVRYTITDLGTLGGTYSYAYGINNKGVVSGGAATETQTNGATQTAFRWSAGDIVDLGTLAGKDCPDCSSEAAGTNVHGESAVLSEVPDFDPNGEDFCGFGTHHQCLPAVWKKGSLKALPTLRGGNNASPFWINNLGQLVGLAENGVLDSTCAGPTPFQVQRFEAVIWEPNGEIRQLRPLEGDTVAFGFGINDEGQAIGSSGLCSNTALPPFVAGPQAAHAVLWDKDGTPRDLGNLVSGASINIPGGINNKGEVVGGAQAADGTIHTFLWTKETGMQDLGGFPGAFLTTAPCCHTINERGQVVGFSIDATTGNVRAIVWQDKKPVNLNTLSPGSPLYLLQAASINDDGQIAGIGVDAAGNPHAFLATPSDSDSE